MSDQEYRKLQFDRLKISRGATGGIIKIISSQGETNFLKIEEDELKDIIRLLS